MPTKYIPYTPSTVEGQAILDNITRTQRLLKYRDNDKVYHRIKRGMPYYEVVTEEHIGQSSDNIVLRGECISACAYLKEQNTKVDLVYIDPPFASGADYAKKVYIRKNPKLAEQISQAEQEMDADELKAFEETMYGDIWKKEDYLNWMYENLQAIKSVMSDTGSIYVHLDENICHYVKILMDEIFGEENFRREIIWDIQVLSGFKTLAPNWVRGHDTIFYYVKNSEEKFFNKIRQQHTKEYEEMFNKTDSEGRKYMVAHKKTRYWDEVQEKGKPFGDVWGDIMSFQQQPTSSEKVEYATQKPEALLERIIKASSNKGMVVADFFGGSGVAAKVANDLGRKFIHCDIGVNSIQTVRDRLIAEKANFQILEVKDGVSLFRNPQQTMDKLAMLITGLQRQVEGVSSFWTGAIHDSKLGTMPVYVPNLIDSQQKVLDIPTINRIINQEIQELEIEASKAIVYYIDIDDEKELRQFIKDNNATVVDIELRDLKNLLHETVVNDQVQYTCNKVKIKNENKDLFDPADAKPMFEVTIDRFVSDRLLQKINTFNEKGNLQSINKGRNFEPIRISKEGLELIEMVSLDCQNTQGVWHSTAELKIDKLGYTIVNGEKTKKFWDGKILCNEQPLRLKTRNISGDELIVNIER